MGKLTKTFKKEEVFYLVKEIKTLLNLLDGTIVEAEDQYKLKYIENQKSKLEKMLINYEPTIYDEYSSKVKRAYSSMIMARKEYDRVILEKCFVDVIQKAKLDYENKVKEYERLKEIREKLKEGLSQAM